MDGKQQILLHIASGAIYAGLTPVLAFRCAMTPWGWKILTHVLSKTRGEPCAICQSRWTAVVRSYDCLAKDDLHHSDRQGCVAKMAEYFNLGSYMTYCSTIIFVDIKTNGRCSISKSDTTRRRFLLRRIHVALNISDEVFAAMSCSHDIMDFWCTSNYTMIISQQRSIALKEVRMKAYDLNHNLQNKAVTWRCCDNV